MRLLAGKRSLRLPNGVPPTSLGEPEVVECPCAGQGIGMDAPIKPQPAIDALSRDKCDGIAANG